MKKKQVLLMVGIFILGLVLMLCSAVVKKYRGSVEWNGNSYNIENVNSVDAKFARPYNEKLDNLGDLFLSCLCAGTMLLVLISFVISKDKRKGIKEALFEAYVFLISYIYSNAVCKFLKVFAGRIRPYMYFANPEQKGIETGDFYHSWPSGHSANSFMIIAFVVFFFTVCHSDSKFKKPVIVLFFLAGISIMVLRMLSGNHFLTDVLSGAAIGFVCAYFMDLLCNRIRGKKIED